MEREIKFRGKTTDGKWVNGYYLPWHSVRDTDGKDVYGQIFEEHKEKDGYISKGCWITVRDNTIGQYTGLKDKNDVEIYEGDIVVFSNFYSQSNGFKHVGRVRYYAGAKPISDSGKNCVDLAECNPEDLTVLGNIYDNPELFEVQS